ncbi:MAG: membrane protein insertase YidC [Geobacteraceae bacterium]|nr:membrane protein insertase YidC [Geobacteraceae bacterium]
MEKRTILAVVLSIGVFYLFSFFYGPEKKAVAPTASVPVKTENVGAAPAVSVQTAAATPPIAKTASTADVVVETERYTAVFSGYGASLKSLTLKGFRETNKPGAAQVKLLANADPALPSFSTRGVGFALSAQAAYSSNLSSLKVLAGEKKQLVFTYVDAQGFVVRKTYGFDGNGYGISLETQLVNNSAAPIAGSFQHLLTSPFEQNQSDKRYETYGSSLYADGSLHTDAPKNVTSATKKYDKGVTWAAINDKYFLSALLSVNNSIASVELKKSAAGYLESDISTPAFSVAPGQAVTVSHKLFVGPKEIDILKTQGSSLEQSLDLGWFSALAKPMLYSLKFFYRYVGNYGIAIIIITVILKIFFFPLTHKSYKSMKEMGKLQPKMAALKEKHKNDKDAMNRAVMELYRDHKVNPLGGCLPMLVQIPVFFSLYKALMYSIELRHAPFMFWITDLSDKDPYYVTPVIMGVTMFIQQKMTPSNMDEMQQKIMLGLPVIFTFMFLSFPSGLVLYWLINNILTIAQQAYINKLVSD